MDGIWRGKHHEWSESERQIWALEINHETVTVICYLGREQWGCRAACWRPAASSRAAGRTLCWPVWTDRTPPGRTGWTAAGRTPSGGCRRARAALGHWLSGAQLYSCRGLISRHSAHQTGNSIKINQQDLFTSFTNLTDDVIYLVHTAFSRMSNFDELFCDQCIVLFMSCFTASTL